MIEYSTKKAKTYSLIGSRAAFGMSLYELAEFEKNLRGGVEILCPHQRADRQPISQKVLLCEIVIGGCGVITVTFTTNLLALSQPEATVWEAQQVAPSTNKSVGFNCVAEVSLAYQSIPVPVALKLATVGLLIVQKI